MRSSSRGDAHDKLLRLKLVMLSKKLETNIMLAQRCTDSDYTNDEVQDDGLEFHIWDTTVDGQAVRVHIWSLLPPHIRHISHAFFKQTTQHTPLTTGGLSTLHWGTRSWYGTRESAMLHRNAAGVLLTFAVEDRAAFAECRALLAEARRCVPGVPAMCCGVIGMVRWGAERTVTEAEARALCAELGIEYCEVDVRFDDGSIHALFGRLAREMMNHGTLPPSINENA